MIFFSLSFEQISETGLEMHYENTKQLLMKLISISNNRIKNFDIDLKNEDYLSINLDDIYRNIICLNLFGNIISIITFFIEIIFIYYNYKKSIPILNE